MTSPIAHKDIFHAIAVDTSKAIIKDMGDFHSAVLVNESRDVATKE